MSSRIAGVATVLGAVATIALAATPASAAPSTVQASAVQAPAVAQAPVGEFQWVGPFDSEFECKVYLQLAQNGDFCQWNPYPPDTYAGWWYMHT